MAETPDFPNSLQARGRGRAIAEGDAPAALLRRYYTDSRGGAGLGFYVDSRVATPAFRDTGRQLVAARADPNSIRDMVAIARHRDWRVVVARGAPDFRREAWLAGRAAGIEVGGYRPSERDMQELDRRIVAGERWEARGSARPHERQPDTGWVDPNRDQGVRSRLRTVEAVVRARVADPGDQSRMLASARERIASWLERGALFEPVPTRQPTINPASLQERHRNR
jgi:hypothetical protein